MITAEQRHEIERFRAHNCAGQLRCESPYHDTVKACSNLTVTPHYDPATSRTELHKMHNRCCRRHADFILLADCTYNRGDLRPSSLPSCVPSSHHMYKASKGVACSSCSASQLDSGRAARCSTCSSKSGGSILRQAAELGQLAHPPAAICRRRLQGASAGSSTYSTRGSSHCVTPNILERIRLGG